MNPDGSNYDELKNAVVGATQQGSPTSPLGSFPELAKMYSSSFQVPLSEAATHVQAAQTATTVDNQKAAAAAARAAQANAAKDMLDASKYQVIPKDDGGFKFVAPNGQEVSAYDYSRIAGTTPNKVLADSQNPIDIGYRQDYQNLQDYIQAKLNSNHDDNAKQQAQAIEDAVKKDSGTDLAKMKIQDVIERFKQAYPTVYGRTNTGVQSGKLFVPGTPGASSGYGVSPDVSAGIGS